MGSRIKKNPDKIFNLFFEAASPASSDDHPQVLRQFPVDFDDQESTQMLPKFCFPFDVESRKPKENERVLANIRVFGTETEGADKSRVKESPTVQHFTFALTDMEGKQRFGFCRMAIGLHSCLCILSYLPWFEIFYKILNYIADNLTKKQFTELDLFLSAVYSHPVPNLSSVISLEFDPKVLKLKISAEKDLHRQDSGQGFVPGTTSAYFIVPNHSKLPTIPENRNLTEFVVAVDVNNMLHLYASLLHERRILLSSSKLSTLTACVQAASSLLYPMHWQHIYIPALPSHLLDYCCAPMPYLIGVHTSLIERVKSKALEDVVILNIDSNMLESPFSDLADLPSDVISLLKFQLKRQSASTGDGVARSFLRAQALLFGTYRKALVYSPGEPISFCKDIFLQQGSSAMQAFLQQAVHLQLFKQFIDDRLEKLNTGDDLPDLFEEEINRTLAPGSMHSYQLLVENLKKGGGALINTMKSKANPAVRNVYQYAKDHAKMGLKSMRNHLLDKESSIDQHRQRGHSLNCDSVSSPDLPTRTSQSDSLQRRLPIVQHFGKSRPRRPQRTNSKTELEVERDDSTCSSTNSLHFSLDPNEGEVPESPDSDGFDLLGEIFETLNLMEPTQAKLPLYGTRSLDFGTLEERNFYTKLRCSREALHEPLSEEQDDDESFFEDTTLLIAPENVQTAWQLSTTEGSSEMGNCGIPKSEEVPGLQNAAAPLQEEIMAVSAICDFPQENQIQQAGYMTSDPKEYKTESCIDVPSGQACTVDQTFELSSVTPSSKAEPLATKYSPGALLETKLNATTHLTANDSSPVLGQTPSPPCFLASKGLHHPKVSELKKKFEA